ncbi:MAG: hypothetical protein U9Q81_13645 [Pseudomonadota bacterium]|nr:hypothetical protein [Pseudomonadota bacterium]
MNDPLSDKDLSFLADRLLLEQGRLDPLELFLAAELLSYDNYEAWRLGRVPDLQGLLDLPPQEAADLLERAAVYARAQGLAATTLEHRAWGGRDQTLRIGAHAGLIRGCSTAFAPPADRHQLDLFHDSTGLLLEEEIRQSLAERNTEAARETVARLMKHDSRHRQLRGFLRLIQAIDETGSLNAKTRLRELEAVEPLARELLGYRARDYLAPLWADLAESVAGLPFSPGAPRLHASFLWGRAGRWEAACQAVEAEPDWQRQPVLLLIHAEACWRTRQQAAARRDWMWLCWDDPLEAEHALGSRELPDRRLSDLWSRFGDAELGLETEDFPAWLLVEDSGAAAVVPPDAAPADERGAGYRLLHRLVSGEDDISLRRELADTHPDLLRLFLSHRD